MKTTRRSSKAKVTGPRKNEGSTLALNVNIGCGPDNWGDVRVDVGYSTQIGVPSVLNLRADAHYLPFRDRAFDYARCWHVLEHLANPHQALREIRRVARTGELRFPLGDGYKRYVLVGLLDMSLKEVRYAYKTRVRHAHLWIIYPWILAGPLGWRYGDMEVFNFVRLGRKARFFRRIRLPRIRNEWIVHF